MAWVALTHDTGQRRVPARVAPTPDQYHQYYGQGMQGTSQQSQFVEIDPTAGAETEFFPTSNGTNSRTFSHSRNSSFVKSCDPILSWTWDGSMVNGGYTLIPEPNQSLEDLSADGELLTQYMQELHSLHYNFSRITRSATFYHDHFLTDLDKTVRQARNFAEFRWLLQSKEVRMAQGQTTTVWEARRNDRSYSVFFPKFSQELVMTMAEEKGRIYSDYERRKMMDSNQELEPTMALKIDYIDFIYRQSHRRFMMNQLSVVKGERAKADKHILAVFHFQGFHICGFFHFEKVRDGEFKIINTQRKNPLTHELEVFHNVTILGIALWDQSTRTAFKKATVETLEKTIKTYNSAMKNLGYSRIQPGPQPRTPNLVQSRAPVRKTAVTKSGIVFIPTEEMSRAERDQRRLGARFAGVDLEKLGFAVDEHNQPMKNRVIEVGPPDMRNTPIAPTYVRPPTIRSNQVVPRIFAPSTSTSTLSRTLPVMTSSTPIRRIDVTPRRPHPGAMRQGNESFLHQQPGRSGYNEENTDSELKSSNERLLIATALAEESQRRPVQTVRTVIMPRTADPRIAWNPQNALHYRQPLRLPQTAARPQATAQVRPQAAPQVRTQAGPQARLDTELSFGARGPQAPAQIRLGARGQQAPAAQLDLRRNGNSNRYELEYLQRMQQQQHPSTSTFAVQQPPRVIAVAARPIARVVAQPQAAVAPTPVAQETLPKREDIKTTDEELEMASFVFNSSRLDCDPSCSGIQIPKPVGSAKRKTQYTEKFTDADRYRVVPEQEKSKRAKRSKSEVTDNVAMDTKDLESDQIEKIEPEVQKSKRKPKRTDLEIFGQDAEVIDRTPKTKSRTEPGPCFILEKRKGKPRGRHAPRAKQDEPGPSNVEEPLLDEPLMESEHDVDISEESEEEQMPSTSTAPPPPRRRVHRKIKQPKGPGAGLRRQRMREEGIDIPEPNYIQGSREYRCLEVALEVVDGKEFLTPKTPIIDLAQGVIVAKQESLDEYDVKEIVQERLVELICEVETRFMDEDEDLVVRQFIEHLLDMVEELPTDEDLPIQPTDEVVVKRLFEEQDELCEEPSLMPPERKKLKLELESEEAPDVSDHEPILSSSFEPSTAEPHFEDLFTTPVPMPEDDYLELPQQILEEEVNEVIILSKPPVHEEAQKTIAEKVEARVSFSCRAASTVDSKVDVQLAKPDHISNASIVLPDKSTACVEATFSDKTIQCESTFAQKPAEETVQRILTEKVTANASFSCIASSIIKTTKRFELEKPEIAMSTSTTWPSKNVEHVQQSFASIACTSRQSKQNIEENAEKVMPCRNIERVSASFMATPRSTVTQPTELQISESEHTTSDLAPHEVSPVGSLEGEEVELKLGIALTKTKIPSTPQKKETTIETAKLTRKERAELAKSNKISTQRRGISINLPIVQVFKTLGPQAAIHGIHTPSTSITKHVSEVPSKITYEEMPQTQDDAVQDIEEMSITEQLDDSLPSTSMDITDSSLIINAEIPVIQEEPSFSMESGLISYVSVEKPSIPIAVVEELVLHKTPELEVITLPAQQSTTDNAAASEVPCLVVPESDQLESTTEQLETSIEHLELHEEAAEVPSTINDQDFEYVAPADNSLVATYTPELMADQFMAVNVEQNSASEQLETATDPQQIIDASAASNVQEIGDLNLEPEQEQPFEQMEAVTKSDAIEELHAAVDVHASEDICITQAPSVLETLEIVDHVTTDQADVSEHEHLSEEPRVERETEWTPTTDNIVTTHESTPADETLETLESADINVQLDQQEHVIEHVTVETDVFGDAHTATIEHAFSAIAVTTHEQETPAMQEMSSQEYEFEKIERPEQREAVPSVPETIERQEIENVYATSENPHIGADEFVVSKEELIDSEVEALEVETEHLHGEATVDIITESNNVVSVLLPISEAEDTTASVTTTVHPATEEDVITVDEQDYISVETSVVSAKEPEAVPNTSAAKWDPEQWWIVDEDDNSTQHSVADKHQGISAPTATPMENSRTSLNEFYTDAAVVHERNTMAKSSEIIASVPELAPTEAVSDATLEIATPSHTSNPTSVTAEMPSLLLKTPVPREATFSDSTIQCESTFAQKPAEEAVQRIFTEKVTANASFSCIAPSSIKTTKQFELENPEIAMSTSTTWPSKNVERVQQSFASIACTSSQSKQNIEENTQKVMPCRNIERVSASFMATPRSTVTQPTELQISESEHTTSVLAPQRVSPVWSSEREEVETDINVVSNSFTPAFNTVLTSTTASAITEQHSMTADSKTVEKPVLDVEWLDDLIASSKQAATSEKMLEVYGLATNSANAREDFTSHDIARATSIGLQLDIFEESTTKYNDNGLVDAMPARPTFSSSEEQARDQITPHQRAAKYEFGNEHARLMQLLPQPVSDTPPKKRGPRKRKPVGGQVDVPSQPMVPRSKQSTPRGSNRNTYPQPPTGPHPGFGMPSFNQSTEFMPPTHRVPPLYYPPVQQEIHRGPTAEQHQQQSNLQQQIMYPQTRMPAQRNHPSMMQGPRMQQMNPNATVHQQFQNNIYPSITQSVYLGAPGHPYHVINPAYQQMMASMGPHHPQASDMNMGGQYSSQPQHVRTDHFMNMQGQIAPGALSNHPIPRSGIIGQNMPRQSPCPPIQAPMRECAQMPNNNHYGGYPAKQEMGVAPPSPFVNSQKTIRQPMSVGSAPNFNANNRNFNVQSLPQVHNAQSPYAKPVGSIFVPQSPMSRVNTPFPPMNSAASYGQPHSNAGQYAHSPPTNQNETSPAAQTNPLSVNNRSVDYSATHSNAPSASSNQHQSGPSSALQVAKESPNPMNTMQRMNTTHTLDSFDNVSPSSHSMSGSSTYYPSQLSMNSAMNEMHSATSTMEIATPPADIQSASHYDYENPESVVSAPYAQTCQNSTMMLNPEDLFYPDPLEVLADYFPSNSHPLADLHIEDPQSCNTSTSNPMPATFATRLGGQHIEAHVSHESAADNEEQPDKNTKTGELLGEVAKFEYVCESFKTQLDGILSEEPLTSEYQAQLETVQEFLKSQNFENTAPSISSHVTTAQSVETTTMDQNMDIAAAQDIGLQDAQSRNDESIDEILIPAPRETTSDRPAVEPMDQSQVQEQNASLLLPHSHQKDESLTNCISPVLSNTNNRDLSATPPYRFGEEQEEAEHEDQPSTSTEIISPSAIKKSKKCKQEENDESSSVTSDTDLKGRIDTSAIDTLNALDPRPWWNSHYWRYVQLHVEQDKEISPLLKLTNPNESAVAPRNHVVNVIGTVDGQTVTGTYVFEHWLRHTKMLGHHIAKLPVNERRRKWEGRSKKNNTNLEEWKVEYSQLVRNRELKPVSALDFLGNDHAGKDKKDKEYPIADDELVPAKLSYYPFGVLDVKESPYQYGPVTGGFIIDARNDYSKDGMGKEIILANKRDKSFRIIKLNDVHVWKKVVCEELWTKLFPERWMKNRPIIRCVMYHSSSEEKNHRLMVEYLLKKTTRPDKVQRPFKDEMEKTWLRGKWKIERRCLSTYWKFNATTITLDCTMTRAITTLQDVKDGTVGGWKAIPECQVHILSIWRCIFIFVFLKIKERLFPATRIQGWTSGTAEVSENVARHLEEVIWSLEEQVNMVFDVTQAMDWCQTVFSYASTQQPRRPDLAIQLALANALAQLGNTIIPDELIELLTTANQSSDSPIGARRLGGVTPIWNYRKREPEHCELQNITSHVDLRGPTERTTARNSDQIDVLKHLLENVRSEEIEEDNPRWNRPESTYHQQQTTDDLARHTRNYWRAEALSASDSTTDPLGNSYSTQETALMSASSEGINPIREEIVADLGTVVQRANIYYRRTTKQTKAPRPAFGQQLVPELSDDFIGISEYTVWTPPPEEMRGTPIKRSVAMSVASDASTSPTNKMAKTVDTEDSLSTAAQSVHNYAAVKKGTPASSDSGISLPTSSSSAYTHDHYAQAKKELTAAASSSGSSSVPSIVEINYVAMKKGITPACSDSGFSLPSSISSASSSSYPLKDQVNLVRMDPSALFLPVEKLFADIRPAKRPLSECPALASAKKEDHRDEDDKINQAKPMARKKLSLPMLEQLDNGTFNLKNVIKRTTTDIIPIAPLVRRPIPCSRHNIRRAIIEWISHLRVPIAVFNGCSQLPFMYIDVNSKSNKIDAASARLIDVSVRILWDSRKCSLWDKFFAIQGEISSNEQLGNQELFKQIMMNFDWKPPTLSFHQQSTLAKYIGVKILPDVDEMTDASNLQEQLLDEDLNKLVICEAPSATKPNVQECEPSTLGPATDRIEDHDYLRDSTSSTEHMEPVISVSSIQEEQQTMNLPSSALSPSTRKLPPVIPCTGATTSPLANKTERPAVPSKADMSKIQSTRPTSAQKAKMSKLSSSMMNMKISPSKRAQTHPKEAGSPSTKSIEQAAAVLQNLSIRNSSASRSQHRSEKATRRIPSTSLATIAKRRTNTNIRKTAAIRPHTQKKSLGATSRPTKPANATGALNILALAAALVEKRDTSSSIQTINLPKKHIEERVFMFKVYTYTCKIDHDTGFMDIETKCTDRHAFGEQKRSTPIGRTDHAAHSAIRKLLEHQKTKFKLVLTGSEINWDEMVKENNRLHQLTCDSTKILPCKTPSKKMAPIGNRTPPRSKNRVVTKAAVKSFEETTTVQPKSQPSAATEKTTLAISSGYKVTEPSTSKHVRTDSASLFKSKEQHGDISKRKTAPHCTPTTLLAATTSTVPSFVNVKSSEQHLRLAPSCSKQDHPKLQSKDSKHSIPKSHPDESSHIKATPSNTPSFFRQARSPTATQSSARQHL